MVKHTTLIVFATTLLLSACGDKNSDKPEADSTAQPIQSTKIEKAKGKFLDAAVGNLDVYQSGKKVSVTAVDGSFEYEVGKKTTFKVGRLILGSTMPKAIVTPLDLSDKPDQVTEILQALQSLDEDKNPDNGIFIPTAMADKLVTDRDLSQEGIGLSDTLKKDIKDLVLVSASDANKHFNKTKKMLGLSITTDNIHIEKKDKLSGYWKTDCILGKDSGSVLYYITLEKKTDGSESYRVFNKLKQVFEAVDCYGTNKMYYHNSGYNTISADQLKLLQFENDDRFVFASEKYNRITYDDYPQGNFIYNREEVNYSNLVSGKVSFEQGNAPIDARIRITPKELQIGSYGSVDCDISLNGNFGTNCIAKKSTADLINTKQSNTTYEVIIYHDVNGDRKMNCNEDIYKLVGRDVAYQSWSSIDVKSHDFRSRRNKCN